jgi:serine/threonine protein phosphatase PrpC
MSDIDPRQVATASLTSVGQVRTHNEDYCSEFQDARGQRLLVVADGMGGHKGGATASRITVEAIGEVFERGGGDPEETLRAAFRTANERVHSMAHENPDLRGMGTTAVTLLLGGGGAAWVAHVGDSRAYRVRKGDVELLTADHSVVGEMLRQGLITPADAAVHPRRNEILRSVGVEPTVDPELVRLEVGGGDRFVLCSDGLSNVVRDDEIGAVLQRESPSQAAQTLVDTANVRGAPDNVTVQIAAVPGGAATEVSGTPRVPRAVLEHEAFRDARQRRVRRIAAATAAVAGLLAAALVFYLIESDRSVEELPSLGASRTEGAR